MLLEKLKPEDLDLKISYYKCQQNSFIVVKTLNYIITAYKFQYL